MLIGQAVPLAAKIVLLSGLAGLLGLAGAAIWLKRRSDRRRGATRRGGQVVVVADDPNMARVVAEAWLSGGAVAGFVGDDGVLRTRRCGESFVKSAAELERGGSPDSALDLIYDRVDELLRGAEWSACAAVLDDINVSECSTDILLALLTATLPAKNRIPSRGGFLERVDHELRTRGEHEDRLLAGLA